MPIRGDIRTIYIDEEFIPIWKAFKEICKREDESISQKIRGMIARYVAVHRKGNPQLLLATFIGKMTHKCWRCEGMFPKLIPVLFISGLQAELCPVCYDANKAKGGLSTIEKVLK